MSIDTLPLADVLDQTATLYETVAALPAVVEKVEAARRSQGGAALPPGMGDILDADEWGSAVAAVDEWALFLAHVLVDEVEGIGSVPDSTPARLRLASRWTDHLEAHPDTHLRYAIGLDAREHLVALRRLSKRGTKVIRTRSLCMNPSCTGEYIATITGKDDDGDLVCSACRDRVPASRWQHWGARAEWITAQRAALLLGCSVPAVWQRAKREGWRRQGTHHATRYHRDDVTGGTMSGSGTFAVP